jgi:hypothetical protein
MLTQLVKHQMGIQKCPCLLLKLNDKKNITETLSQNFESLFENVEMYKSFL